jgi:O-antigen/teichoic acid export membrane protein
MSPSGLARDSLWNGISFGIRVAGSVVAQAWVARALGPEGQGRFAWVLWLGMMGGQLAVWGLAASAVRFVARAVGRGDTGEARRVVRRLERWLGFSTLAVAALGIAATLGWGGDLRTALLATLVHSCAAGVFHLRSSLAWGLRRWDIDAASQAAYFAVLFVGLLAALNGPDPLVGALLAFALSRAVQAGLLWSWTEAVLAAPMRWERSSADGGSGVDLDREMRRYAVELSGIILFSTLLWERAEILALQGPGAWHELGLYTAAFGLSIGVMRVPQVLGLVLVPVVAELDGGGASRERLGATFARAARLLTLVVAGPSAVAAAAAPSLVRAVYGREYEGAAPLLAILLLPLLVAGAGNAGSRTLVGGGGERALLRLTATGAAAKLAMALLWVRPFGVLGVALATALSQAACLLLEARLAARRFPRPATAPMRWREQAIIVALGAGVCLLAGPLAAAMAAVAVPSPENADWQVMLAACMQLGAGLTAWGAAAVWRKPLPAADVEALRVALPPGGWGARARWALAQVSAGP